MPSNRRTCPHCKAEMACGIRTCQTCGTLLALKERHTKGLQDFRQQAVQWAKKTKEGGNGAKVVDRSIMMIEKMKALGHIPIIMWGKPKRCKAGGWNVEMFFPFQLPTEGIVVLDKLLGLFEGLLQGCNFTEGSEDSRDTQEMGEEVVEEGEMGEEWPEDLGDTDTDTDAEAGEMGEDGGDKDGQGMAEHEDGEEEMSVKELEDMVEAEEVETEPKKKKQKKGPAKRTPLVTIAGKRKRKQRNGDDDQCVESSLEVKMNSPDSASDVSIKQEEPEDISIKQEEPEYHPHPEEPVGSMTLLAIKGEVDEDISSHCFEVEVEIESDTEVTEDSDDLEETSGGVHTREKPFHCQHCDKSFIQSSDLTKHQHVHTGTWIRPFHCKQCDKSFFGSANLKTHQRIHTGEKPFHCQHCDKSFIQSSDLKKHHRVHTGEKSFHCKQCDKSFSHSGDVKRHQRIHTGEKPFHCTQCDKTFCRSDELKAHQRSVHILRSNPLKTF